MGARMADRKATPECPTLVLQLVLAHRQWLVFLGRCLADLGLGSLLLHPTRERFALTP